ncbi:MAG: hypothetical protein U5N27_02495 [Rhizobium sp.]|nr:hypothetical protein [Rhizobium sp.]
MKRKHQPPRQRDLFDTALPIQALPNKESLRILVACLLSEIQTAMPAKSEGACDDEDHA